MFKAENGDQYRDVKQPVDHRDVNLPGFDVRGIDDSHRRQIPHAHSLTRQGEHAGNHRLRGNHRRQRRQHQQRDQRPAGRQKEKRILDSVRVAEQQRALTEIIHHQRRANQHNPRDADRFLTKMPHIRVQGFAAGHRQHHHAQREERHLFEFDKKMQRPVRVQRLQHVRVTHNAADPQYRQHHKPHHHHRRKDFPHAAGAVFLNEEQQRQHRNGRRNDKAIKRRRNKFQPFNGGKHGDRGRDDAVAIKETAADQAEKHNDRHPARIQVTHRQRHQRKDPAFPVVIRTHHKADVFH